MSLFVCSSRFLPLQSSAALVPGGGGVAGSALWQRPRLAEFRVSPSRQRPATAGQRVITAAAPPEVAVAGGRVMGSGRVSLIQRVAVGRRQGTRHLPNKPFKTWRPYKAFWGVCRRSGRGRSSAAFSVPGRGGSPAEQRPVCRTMRQSGASERRDVAFSGGGAVHAKWRRGIGGD